MSPSSATRRFLFAFRRTRLRASREQASNTSTCRRSSLKKAKAVFFEFTPKIIWALAARRITRLSAFDATIRYPYTGSACPSAARSPLDKAHLARFRALVERYEPALVSEHLAWSTHEATFFNDLLPLPYTKTTLERVSDHIDEVQEAIRRPILLENPSTYVAFHASTMRETDFIRAIAQRTDAGCCSTSTTSSYRRPIMASRR